MGDNKREEQEGQGRCPLLQHGTSLLLTSLGKSRQTEHWKRDRSTGGGHEQGGAVSDSREMSSGMSAEVVLDQTLPMMVVAVGLSSMSRSLVFHRFQDNYFFFDEVFIFFVT